MVLFIFPLYDVCMEKLQNKMATFHKSSLHSDKLVPHYNWWPVALHAQYVQP